MNKNPEAPSDICPHGVLEALLYIHIPPKLDGIDEDDRECKACIKSLEPSDSYNQVHLCEKDIVDTFGDTPEFDKIQYQIEMSEQDMIALCDICEQPFTRDKFSSHSCFTSAKKGWSL